MPDVILIADDEASIRDLARLYLEKEGFRVQTVENGALALAHIRREPPALLVLDLMMPEVDGWEVCRRLRAEGSLPILMLTARDQDIDKIVALEMGADDYLTKPFGVGELLARVRVLLRRHAADGDRTPIRRFGDVEVDLARHVARRGAEDLRLTQIEFRLLAVLLANAGKVLTHRHLMHEVWGPGHAGQEHYLRIYVRRLRQKLETDPARPRHLLTETGVGYRFQP